MIDGSNGQNVEAHDLIIHKNRSLLLACYLKSVTVAFLAAVQQLVAP